MIFPEICTFSMHQNILSSISFSQFGKKIILCSRLLQFFRLILLVYGFLYFCFISSGVFSAVTFNVLLLVFGCLYIIIMQAKCWVSKSFYSRRLLFNFNRNPYAFLYNRLICSLRFMCSCMYVLYSECFFSTLFFGLFICLSSLFASAICRARSVCVCGRISVCNVFGILPIPALVFNSIRSWLAITM